MSIESVKAKFFEECSIEQGKRRPFSKEFRLAVGKLANSGATCEELSKEFDVSISSVWKWRREAKENVSSFVPVKIAANATMPTSAVQQAAALVITPPMGLRIECN